MRELSFSEVTTGVENDPGSAGEKYRAIVNILVEPPGVTDHGVAVAATMTNVRSTPATICIASSTLFVSPPNDPRVRYVGVLRPAPAPPPPYILQLPPQSFVRIGGTWNFHDWSWEGAIDVETWWSFSLVPGPHVSGRIRVTLPSARRAS
jgi:hypothetical protein